MISTYNTYLFLIKSRTKKLLRIVIYLFVNFLFSTFNTLVAQVTETPAGTTEQQIENVTANNEDNETEDDSYLQQMQHFIKNPVNLNTADEAELKELIVLSPLQIASLVSYRKLLGNLISIYELQSVPGWDLELYKKYYHT
ncbi:MAG: helix-hairpin-helix domain-containing protein [Chitinophagaceae bacterium]|nr:helix-hairpin-helix domain-containing protein [Chitinophagaceae bacterium]